MFYSAKRQQYLIDQGYTFKIVTNLCERASKEAVLHNCASGTPEDDRKLLRTVLTSETDLEKEQRAEDAAIRKSNPDGAGLADAGTKRSAGMTMSHISGGSGMRYRDISSSKKHPLFRKRQQK
jgi:DNA excision repair protein ERCC-3